jgi:hypothetical protein
MMKIDNAWRLDKRVPVAVIVAMLLQLAGILIWATQLDARVSSMEQQMVGSPALGEKFARLEERLEYMKQDVQYIKHQLERLADRMSKK